MKLLLHIGSPKTASTSIQWFCRLNRDLMRTEGFFYPPTPDGIPGFNFLARALAKGTKDIVERFLTEAHAQARKNNCHSVIISAESFFGLALFSENFRPSRQLENEFWEKHKCFVEDLEEACAAYESVDIICYLRAQDEFAASLYHQKIKGGAKTQKDFEDFARDRRRALDYERRIAIWASVFGRNHIHLKNFGAVKADVIRDFCHSYLNDSCFENATHADVRLNTTRLGRDLMEAKRRFNLSCSDRPMAFMASQFFKKISSSFDDQPASHVFADARSMEKFFSAYEEGNNVLSMQYGMAELPPYTRGENLTPYSGLSDARAAEIDDMLNAHFRSPRVRIELLLRRILWFILRHFPGANNLLDPLRRVYNKVRMRRMISR